MILWQLKEELSFLEIKGIANIITKKANVYVVSLEWQFSLYLFFERRIKKKPVMILCLSNQNENKSSNCNLGISYNTTFIIVHTIIIQFKKSLKLGMILT